MASSNIKLFDENKGNMLTDTEFNISTQRLNGLQTGVASSQLQNKAMYQASLIAYAIAQVMMQNGKNANDTDAVSAFVANLSGTMLQKVYDIATTEEAKAGVATGKWMSPALVKAAIDYKFSNAVTFGNVVTLAGDPTENLQAATKQYVDKKAVSIIKPELLKQNVQNFLEDGTYTGKAYYSNSYSLENSGSGIEIADYVLKISGIVYEMELTYTQSKTTSSSMSQYLHCLYPGTAVADRKPILDASISSLFTTGTTPFRGSPQFESGQIISEFSFVAGNTFKWSGMSGLLYTYN